MIYAFTYYYVDTLIFYTCIVSIRSVPPAAAASIGGSEGFHVQRGILYVLGVGVMFKEKFNRNKNIHFPQIYYL